MLSLKTIYIERIINVLDVLTVDELEAVYRALHTMTGRRRHNATKRKNNSINQ